MWKFKTRDLIDDVTSSYVADVTYDAFLEQTGREPNLDEMYLLTFNAFRTSLIKSIFGGSSLFDLIKTKNKL